jgi:hypothetical protein
MTARVDDSRLSTQSRKLLATLYETVRIDDVFEQAPTLSSVRDVFQSSTIASPALIESTLLLWGPVTNATCRTQSSNPVLAEELTYMLVILERMLHESRVSVDDP